MYVCVCDISVMTVMMQISSVCRLDSSIQDKSFQDQDDSLEQGGAKMYSIPVLPSLPIATSRLSGMVAVKKNWMQRDFASKVNPKRVRIVYICSQSCITNN